MGDHVSDDDPRTAARAAIAAGEWVRALGLVEEFTRVDGVDAEGLELVAQAAYGAGEFERAVSAWEDLHTLEVGRGDDLAAARAAAMVAQFLLIDTGLMAPVRGWLRRAERLLGEREETPTHAIVEMVRTYERVMSGDMVKAAVHSRRAIDLGTRHDVQPAVVIGGVAAARLAIFAGDVDRGIEMLDDIAVSLMAGEVDPLTTGMAMCELICAMQGLAMYDRANEWTRAMDHWRQGAAMGSMSGRCRVHRAEMLRLTGPCDEAEDEALAACEELRPWMRREFGWPLAELGNIRLRRGDLAGAEEALLAAHENAWTAEPGLALLRLAQGDAAAADALIRDALDHPFDAPSKERPPFGGLRRAPLLDARVEIAAAVGDGAAARTAADELATIAEEFSSPALVAMAALAEGRAALLEDDPAAAVRACERAVAGWADVGAPFETAVARMVMGDAWARLGNADAATMEWQAAHTAFERFGALLWAERAARALEAGATPAAPVAAAPTEPEPDEATGVFRCEGDTRRVSFDGTSVLVRDLVGLRYLGRLLAEPDREFHVLDLVAVERGSLPCGGSAAAAPDRGDTAPLLDDEAREAYRRRLADVDDDIEEATAQNDLGRLALAQRDREFLLAELTRAAGLGGRDRRGADTTERARTSVTRSLRYAIDRLGEHHPALGRHLQTAVCTGTYCRYAPDSRLPTRWDVG